MKKITLLALAFALAACGSDPVVFGDEGTGGSAGAGGSEPVQTAPDAGPRTPDAGEPADGGSEAPALCYASMDPHACGCCFGTSSNIVCPSGVVPPSEATLTLPLCNPK